MDIYRAKTDSWCVERITILLVGLFVLGSVLLGLHTSSIIIHRLGVPSLLEKYCNRR